MANIEEKILKIIDEAKSVPVQVEKKSNLYNLGFDSLYFVQFLIRIEEIFSIAFTITEMGACLQVDQLIALVEKKIGERSI